MNLIISELQSSSSLKHLSDQKLNEETLLASKKEKQATLVLLEYLSEVDARRLYNARGYSSLWEYVHQYLGYSESQASERVAAMRLMTRVPEVKEKLEKQSITLTTTAKLASFVRRENCSQEKTRELLEQVSDKPTREAERILLSEQRIPEARPDIARPSSPTITRISFDADPEWMELFEELKNLQGHPEWSINDRLKQALRTVVTEKKNKTSEPKKSTPVLRAPEVKKENVPVSFDRPRNEDRSRYIPVSVRRATYTRSQGQCEFVDTQTKRRCESRYALQFDHRYPYAKGGQTTKQNIRHLCPNHNRFLAVKEFGRAKMDRYRSG